MSEQPWRTFDHDGRLEAVVGLEGPKVEGQWETWMLAWYKPGQDLSEPWESHVIDPAFGGGPHDILFADLDGDGKRELVTIACYSATPGIFAYRPPADPTQPWEKHAIQQGIFTEGLSVGDLNGDGRLEIVSAGPTGIAPRPAARGAASGSGKPTLRISARCAAPPA